MGNPRQSPTRPIAISFPLQDWKGLDLGLIVLLILTALDVWLGQPVVLTGVFVVAPFLSALRGARIATVVLAALTVVLVASSGIWNDNFGDTDYWVRLGLICAASLFSCQAAWVIARSRAAARQLELLNEFAAEADDSSSLQSTLERICDLAIPELADICLIDAVSSGHIERINVRVGGPRRAELEPRLAGREPTVPPELVGDDAALSPFLNRWVSDQDLQNMAHSAEDLELLRSIGVRSIISVAVSARGRRVGVMTLVQAWSGRRHSEDDSRFAQILAARVGLALENAGLFSDLEGIERRMDTVMEVLDEAVAINDRKGRLIFANQAAIELAGCDSLDQLKMMVADEPGAFAIYDEFGEPLDEPIGPQISPNGGGSDLQVVRVVRRSDASELWLRVRSKPVLGADGQPLYWVSALEDLTEIKLAEFAHSVMAATGELLVTSTDPDRMLQRLAGLLVPQLADCCSIHIQNEDMDLPTMAVAHRNPERFEGLEALMNEGPLDPGSPGLAALMKSEGPLALDDLSTLGAHPPDVEVVLQRMNEFGLGSALFIPLVREAQPAGLLVFANHAGRRPFTDNEQLVSGEIAERVAAAFQNAQVAVERRAIAETLQQALRPPEIPQIPGWSVAAAYRPAGLENRVGGDFYDLFRIDDGWMVVIGDVTGHGARAASVTALARYTLRTAGSMTGSPVEALSQLNEALLAQPGNSLCSVAAITLDQPALGTVKVAAAGHPRPLLIDGPEIVEVDPSGPVLGAFADAAWTLEEIEVGPQQQLFVYTDGVTEARNGDQRFGEQRLHQSLSGAGDPALVIGSVDRALRDFCQQNLDDDAAFLALMRLEPMQTIEGSAHVPSDTVKA